MSNKWGKKWKQWQILFSWTPKSLRMVTAAMKLKDTHSLEVKDKPRQCIKKQRYYVAEKGPNSQSYDFPISHVQMWELGIKKAECWRTDAFELWLKKTLESPLDCKEIQPVNSTGNRPWIFIERTDAEAEAPVLWPLDMKSHFLSLEKILILGKIESMRRR